jgi:glutamate dehydrogenase (NAD(P)+)
VAVSTPPASFAQRDARLIAASDSRGATSNPGELDVDALIAHERTGQGVSAFAAGSPMKGEDLVGVECEICAARHVGRLRARLVLQGANIPATDAAEREMHARGILSLPDFVASAARAHGTGQALPRQRARSRAGHRSLPGLDRAGK